MNWKPFVVKILEFRTYTVNPSGSIECVPTVGVNKTFPYRSRTIDMVRWYRMKSMWDVRNHYAPHGT